MFKKINKVPAGMFLIPLVVSLVLVSIFPNMYDAIGGTTQQTFQMGTNVVIGLLVFSAGTSLDLKQIVPLIKRHLPIILFKLVISTIYILVFYWLFGLDGIFGINLLAFACVIYSLNPAVALAIHSSYGDKQFGAVYGIMGLIGMPFAPLILLSILTADDWSFTTFHRLEPRCSDEYSISCRCRFATYFDGRNLYGLTVTINAI
ncbi:2-keto-3-deoxygluconate permease [Aerococcus sp. 150760007-1]|uniref:2-keto-3-deoxygluconate permease n=1 Tax=Aerococcus urinaeequi TaxID=51665 RepID=UPI002174F58F|nr:2-keto-3-deoxygluconate permease [Aerococcus urinaeequi]